MARVVLGLGPECSNFRCKVGPLLAYSLSVSGAETTPRSNMTPTRATLRIRKVFVIVAVLSSTTRMQSFVLLCAWKRPICRERGHLNFNLLDSVLGSC